MTLSFWNPNTTNQHPQPKKLLWHLRKSENPKTADNYKQVFTESTKNLLPDCTPSFCSRHTATRYIEDFNTKFCQTIYTSLDQVCGWQSTLQNTHAKNFWTQEMQDVFNLKGCYYRKWRKACGLNCLTYWILHQETKARLRRLVLRRRQETWR